MYPWLSGQEQQLTALIRRRQLGHALLLKGVAGTGKRELATELARVLLCQHTTVASNEQPAPCGHCHSCQLIKAGNHSDLHVVTGQQRSIGVDAIRQLTQVLSESARLGHGKVAVIEQADKMTEAAANALLKTLEEPAGEATLLLTSAHPERLLPTIRSRCQQWLLPVPESDVVLRWLSDQGLEPNLAALNVNQGSPLGTRDYLAAGTDKRRQELLQQFALLAKQPQTLTSVQSGLLEQPVHLLWLQLLLQDALQLALGLSSTGLRLVDSEALCRTLSQLGPERLNQALTGLLQLRQTLQPGAGRPVNAGLQLGQWLNDWMINIR
ncbi:DNA polymerase III subunit delta' [Oceanisphaera arctica]|uniref:DNA polymerase III subunit delta' n=1 Tax=Oceanisphaera arctica TaxID=641510 RepID=A0A2P5TJW8_9GAMM|nr:DNA polymerase III subunit delta' [Oceanisphaera arctica]PPL15336.1 DNA polymerase III subunit delta' [Oceanisphaera arctica]GHA29263.1 DNA polymerase III subunit delta' [Oceanisphaera arctica]